MGTRPRVCLSKPFPTGPDSQHGVYCKATHYRHWGGLGQRKGCVWREHFSYTRSLAKADPVPATIAPESDFFTYGTFLPLESYKEEHVKHLAGCRQTMPFSTGSIHHDSLLGDEAFHPILVLSAAFEFQTSYLELGAMLASLSQIGRRQLQLLPAA